MDSRQKFSKRFIVSNIVYVAPHKTIRLDYVLIRDGLLHNNRSKLVN